VAAVSFLFPLKTLAELVNIGTLFAFALVSIGVIVLRRTRPDLPRPFRVPLMPVLPILSVIASVWLMLNLQTATWIRFGVWMGVGFIVYFAYSIRHSRLAPGARGRAGEDERIGAGRREGTRGERTGADRRPPRVGMPSR
jgi:APA family basic amino acid/polyamine antiporter